MLGAQSTPLPSMVLLYAYTQRGGRGRGAHFMHGRSGMTIWYRPSHPYNVGTEHVGFPPTRQALLAPSAKRREVLGESHERWAARGVMEKTSARVFTTYLVKQQLRWLLDRQLWYCLLLVQSVNTYLLQRALVLQHKDCSGHSLPAGG